MGRIAASVCVALLQMQRAAGFVTNSIPAQAAAAVARKGALSKINMSSRQGARSTTAVASPPPPPPSGGQPNTVAAMSAQMKGMRAQLEENEQARAYMEALRGSGIQDYDTAVSGSMNLIGADEDDSASDPGDRLPLVYDPEQLESYFGKRPAVVSQRMLQLAGAFSGFVASVVGDRIVGKGEEREVQRAAELRDVMTSLGPFYIKLGQALSIRPDILSPKAMVELQRLCDKVPSYDSEIAFKIIERELGRPIPEIFSEISPEPLAAASLGQVYKATLRSTGDVVAVKVQRPGVLETVSLDLHLARVLGQQLRKVPFLADRTDLVALLDEFASRFYDELNYIKECENGIQIRKDMAHIKQIVVPYNYPEYTSRRVFVSEWLEGEKLSQSTADDVLDLINVGVVAYLTQLLDTGFLHADPHPGNLIRTPEGKLALLDFGLMTQVTDDQKYGMIEAISHLVHRDYASIGDDFKRLDFLPPDVDVAPVVPALANVFDAALAGGGAKAINFQELASDLAQITFDYPFRIPPYFALVIRAIGVLEGIALVGNPDFAIVEEAYPYISKRLLTDESPRLRAALRYMIYGQSNVFDVERLIDMLQAFESFAAIRDDKAGESRIAAAAALPLAATVAVAAPPTPASPAAPPTPASPAALVRSTPMPPKKAAAPAGKSDSAREALRFLFSKEGEFFREFLLDEVVKGVDCVSRDAARELAFTVGLRGPWVPPLFKAMAPKLSKDDQQVVENTRKLLAFMLGDVNNADAVRVRLTPVNPAAGLFGLQVATPPFNLLGLRAGGGNGRLLQEELAPIVAELGPQMREFGLQIVGRLTEKLASRVLRYTSDRVLGNYYQSTAEASPSYSSGRNSGGSASGGSGRARPAPFGMDAPARR